jgi:cytochrome c oxidase cbb3-type subunit I
MLNPPTNAAVAEVTAIDLRARPPLLLLLGAGVAWLVLSGILALIAAVQLHSPAFLQDWPWLTAGRSQALRETTFVYGWAANTGLAIGIWILGRLGGSLLRGLNWTLTGTVFWNLGVVVGLVGIATGDMTSLPLLQMPRYALPLLVTAYAAISITGVLAWTGRRTDSTYASHWYIVAALFLFPWLLTAAQIMLLWSPVRGALQAVAAVWYAQGVWSFWLAPLALGTAYYLIPKISGRSLPNYDFAPVGFWTLLLMGVWTSGRFLLGGPLPAWIGTMGVVAGVMLLFHHFVLVLNLRVGFGGVGGTSMRFVQFGIGAYVLAGLFDVLVSFRGVAVATQFTFFATALETLAYQGAISMIFFGAIYYMLPRLTGLPWSSAALTVGHRVTVMVGVLLAVVSLVAAGWIQSGLLLDGKTPLAEVAVGIRVPLLLATGAQLVILSANLLFLVNFCQSACRCFRADGANPSDLRQPSLEATAT